MSGRHLHPLLCYQLVFHYILLLAKMMRHVNNQQVLLRKAGQRVSLGGHYNKYYANIEAATL